MYFMSFNKLICRKLDALSTLSMLKMYVLYLLNALTIGLLLGIPNAYAETQFLDEFETVNQSIWAYPTGAASFNGRTQMRPNFPNVSNDLLHLQLDTYNPTGNSFYGSEIFSLGKAAPGTGLSAEFKARLVTPVKGLVGGAFLYDIFSTGSHNEIDFELISNLPNKVQTNIYANEPLGAGSPEFNAIPQLDITQFNTYRIEWLPNKVRWFVNNTLIRENTTNLNYSSTTRINA
ncbi:MAG: glycoside hydrolase family 16 protein [Candidatus Aureabacteria bacterium]|nr:glycoside hydrolase family 16 protein [Candidatus Auribacterota bacterium]